MKGIKLAIFFLILTLPIQETIAQRMPSNNKTRAKIRHLAMDFPIADIRNINWERAKEILIDKYWSGKAAPAGRQLKARLLWSDAALYVRFEANQTEPLIVSDAPNLKKKTDGLWNRDVAEIFVAPDSREPRKYYEFEIAPTGEWIDLFIDYTGRERKTEWDYNSGIRSFAKIEKDRVLMAIRIEWKAFGRTPKTGDIWLGNLFRCVGREPDRGYLAWLPTETKTPDFHMPEKFGEFEFGR